MTSLVICRLFSLGSRSYGFVAIISGIQQIKKRSRHNVPNKDQGHLATATRFAVISVGQCPKDVARGRPLDLQLLFCLFDKFECERILLQLILGTRWGRFFCATMLSKLAVKSGTLLFPQMCFSFYDEIFNLFLIYFSFSLPHLQLQTVGFVLCIALLSDWATDTP